MCMCECVCVCVSVCMYPRPFLTVLSLRLQDGFPEIRSIPCVPRARNENTRSRQQYSQENRSKCIQFLLASDCDYILMLLLLPQIFFFHIFTYLKPMQSFKTQQ